MSLLSPLRLGPFFCSVELDKPQLPGSCMEIIKAFFTCMNEVGERIKQVEISMHEQGRRGLFSSTQPHSHPLGSSPLSNLNYVAPSDAISCHIRSLKIKFLPKS